ncbi:hypothetical protein E1212_18590 [Jiangella ureilytica]|uniref:Uncharacterized protein n=1 Tax=Jiangella ureilytica TaxID=2530374 RepID=A0A4R4RIH2_9ACTN|nr:hypothetical protein [Jiangella ureilytica]TDC49331.1 hypothetical protein E1212_18590 [Jiangella ureilytica]
MRESIVAVTPLPWPPEWRRPPLGGWLGAVVFGLLALVLVPVGILALTAGHRVGAAVIAAMLLVLAPVAAGTRPRRREYAVEEVSLEVAGVRQTGVRVPVRPASPLVSLALAILGLAITGLGVAAFVIAAVRGEWSALLGFVVLLVIGSVLLLGGIVGLVTSRRRLGLDLTPSHLVVGLGGDPVVLTWEQVARIGTSSVRYGLGAAARPVQNWLTVVTREPVDVAAAIPADRLGADPVLVYHTLRYYLDNADARPEFGTGAAVRRLAAGEVVVQPGR